MILTQEYVKSILTYDPDSGVFTWLERADRRPAWNGRYAGRRAGTIHKKGYRYIAVDSVSYRASRLAWLYMTGEWPPEQVDHRNGRHGDDSWRNLRLATNAENAQNKLAAKTNTSGFAGVSFHKKSGKWRATICVSGKPKHLGLRDTPEGASALYMEAKRKHHPFLDRA